MTVKLRNSKDETHIKLLKIKVIAELQTTIESTQQSSSLVQW